MAVLMFIFMICATRTNVVYTLIFLSLFLVFILLSSAYWRMGLGDTTVGNRCVVVSPYSITLTFISPRWKSIFNPAPLGRWRLSLRCQSTWFLPTYSPAFRCHGISVSFASWRPDRALDCRLPEKVSCRCS